MARGKRRKRSPRFLEVALEAGVSPSTVDRVLNERGSASDTARRKVLAAAQTLGVPRILPSAAHALMHVDVLLPDNRTPFFLRLRHAMASACGVLDKRMVVHRRVFDEADEAALLRAILQPAYRRRGLILAAPDTAGVRAALREVLHRGEAVVTVVSNVADVPGIAYFGIDNYRAGRTAGFVMGRFARRSGRVMFLSARNDWAAHQQRTAGFRDVLSQSFPHLDCDPAPVEALDDDYRCYVAVAEALRSGGLAGIYNSGAGSAGIRDALEQFDRGRSTSWITHELSDDHRHYLQSGVLAMVVDQDPDLQAFSALRHVVERTAAEPSDVAAAATGSEFRVYFAENVKPEPYLASSEPSAGPGRLRPAAGR